MSRSALRAAADSEIDRWEQAIADELTRMFARQEAVVLARLQGTKARKHTRHWEPPGDRALEVKQIIDPTRWVADAAGSVTPVLRRLFASVYKRVSTQLGGEPTSDRLEKAVAERVRRVAEGVETSIREVEAHIDAAEDAGKPMPDIVKSVQAMYAQRTPGWAARIATASAVGSINKAGLEAAMDAGSSAKQWISQRDSKVRDTHVAADGQVRLLDERFKLGGIPTHPKKSLLMFPGDPGPSVPADEVINCRCVLVFSPPRKQSKGDAPVEVKAAKEWTTACVMALPAEGQPALAQLSEDQEPHATLLFLGERDTLPDTALGTLIERAAAVAEQTARFAASVRKVGTLGDDTPPATVAHLDRAGLAGLRDALLEDPTVTGYLKNATQFPSYTPHITLGYGVDASADGEVVFDRVAVWWGDERYEFSLSGTEVKAKVRTPEGAAHFGQPIGATIVPDLVPSFSAGGAMSGTAAGSRSQSPASKLKDGDRLAPSDADIAALLPAGAGVRSTMIPEPGRPAGDPELYQRVDGARARFVEVKVKVDDDDVYDETHQVSPWVYPSVGKIGTAHINEASGDATVRALVAKHSPGVDLALDRTRILAIRDRKDRVGGYMVWRSADGGAEPKGTVLAVSVHPSLRGNKVGDRLVVAATYLDSDVKASAPRPATTAAAPQSAAPSSRPAGSMPTVRSRALPTDQPGTSGDYDADAARISRLQKAYLRDRMDTTALFSRGGRWSRAREKQQQDIIDHFLTQPGVKADGKLLVIGGLPGSGKTTTINSPAGQAELGIDLAEYVTVNADEVKAQMMARGMVPDYPGLTADEAATLFHAESFEVAHSLMRQAAKRRLNFAYDTSLKSAGQMGFATDAARRSGHRYESTVLFVDVPVDVAKARAKARYLAGGRFMPLSLIERMQPYGRRGHSSLPSENFDVVKRDADRWFAFDNAGAGPVATGSGSGRRARRSAPAAPAPVAPPVRAAAPPATVAPPPPAPVVRNTQVAPAAATYALPPALPPVPAGARVYAHPQGKHIYVLPDGSMAVYKPDGRRTTSSATPAKLAAGYGGWTEVVGPDADPAGAAAAQAQMAPPQAAAPPIVAAPTAPLQVSPSLPAPAGALPVTPMDFNEAPLADVPKYIADDDYWFQQKVDGIRGVLVVEPGQQPWFASKKGDRLQSSTAARVTGPMLAKLPPTPAGSPAYRVEGEILNGKFHVFDMVLVGQESTDYETRKTMADAWVAAVEGGIPQVSALPTARTAAEKQALWDQVLASGAEGVMMKRRTAGYNGGQRVNHTLKAKITATADVVILERNRGGKDNAVFGLVSGGQVVEIGTVSTGGKDKALGQIVVGDVVELEYLWATPGANTLTQPRIVRKRPDKAPADATDVSQLRFVDKTVLAQAAADQKLVVVAGEVDELGSLADDELEALDAELELRFQASDSTMEKLAIHRYRNAILKERLRRKEEAFAAPASGGLPDGVEVGDAVRDADGAPGYLMSVDAEGDAVLRFRGVDRTVPAAGLEFVKRPKQYDDEGRVVAQPRAGGFRTQRLPAPGEGATPWEQAWNTTLRERVVERFVDASGHEVLVEDAYDAEQVDGVLERLRVVLDQAPLKRPLTIRIPKRGADKTFRRTPGAMAYATDGTDTVTVNPALLADVSMAKIIDPARPAASLMESFRSDPALHILAHEIGHQVDFHHKHMRGPQIATARASNAFWRDRKDDLSDYGRSDPAEGYAEAFALWLMRDQLTGADGDREGRQLQIAVEYADKYGWETTS